MAYFPLFIDLNDKDVLVIGGGQVAYRKIKALMDFGGNVTVIAPAICDDIVKMNSANVIERDATKEDCLGRIFVVVATDDNDFNHEIASYCKRKNILVNVVDKKDDCSFIFSSYVRENELVAAFSSSGNSPMLTQYLRDKTSEILTPELGAINDYLGKLRPVVFEKIENEANRKIAYRRILDYALFNGRVPNDKELNEILESIC